MVSRSATESLDLNAADFPASAAVEDVATKFRVTVSLHPSFSGKRVTVSASYSDARHALESLAHAVGGVAVLSGPDTWLICPPGASRWPVFVSGALAYYSDGTTETLAGHSLVALRGRALLDGFPVRIASPVVRVPAAASTLPPPAKEKATERRAGLGALPQ